MTRNELIQHYVEQLREWWKQIQTTDAEIVKEDLIEEQQNDNSNM